MKRLNYQKYVFLAIVTVTMGFLLWYQWILLYPSHITFTHEVQVSKINVQNRNFWKLNEM